MNAPKLMMCLFAVTGAAACTTSAHASGPDYYGPYYGRHVSTAQLETHLAPHGEFVMLADFGRVWRPYHMAADWQPYTYGTWVYDNDDWLWQSDFEWGWAAFHYGRWAYDNHYGWVWVPGSTWGPAWVAWSYDDGYVGWAPLPPRAVWVGSSWSIGIPARSWAYVPRGRFGRHHVHRHIAHRGRHPRHVVRHAHPPAGHRVRAARGRQHDRARPAVAPSAGRARPAPRAHPPKGITPRRATRSARPDFRPAPRPRVAPRAAPSRAAPSRAAPSRGSSLRAPRATPPNSRVRSKPSRSNSKASSAGRSQPRMKAAPRSHRGRIAPKKD